mgnify:CR=1 FL=1
MKNGVFAEALHNLEQAAIEANTDDFVIINMRPGDKISAMLEILAMIHKKSPTVIIAEALSQHIANHAMSSPIYADAIIRSANKAGKYSIGKGTALSILKENGLLEEINHFEFTLEFTK